MPDILGDQGSHEVIDYSGMTVQAARFVDDNGDEYSTGTQQAAEADLAVTDVTAYTPNTKGAYLLRTTEFSLTDTTVLPVEWEIDVLSDTWDPQDGGDPQRLWLGADQTFEDGDVTVGTDVVALSSHGFATGEGPVTLTSGGTLPAGLAADTKYWIEAVDDDSIAFATSRANAIASTRVNITAAAGGGTHTIETADKLVVPAAVTRVSLVGGAKIDTDSETNHLAVAITKDEAFFESSVFAAPENNFNLAAGNQITSMAVATGLIAVDEGEYFRTEIFADFVGAAPEVRIQGTFLNMKIEASSVEENQTFITALAAAFAEVETTVNSLIAKLEAANVLDS